MASILCIETIKAFKEYRVHSSTALLKSKKSLSLSHTHSLRSGCKAVLRMGSIANNKNDGTNIAVTDNGNYIVDLLFTAPIADVALAAKEIKATVGVVDHGIFAGFTTAVIVAGKDGVRVAGAGGEKPWW